MTTKAKCKFGRRVGGKCPPKGAGKKSSKSRSSRGVKLRAPGKKVRRFRTRAAALAWMKANRKSTKKGKKGKRRSRYVPGLWAKVDTNIYDDGGSSYSEKTIRGPEYDGWRDYVINCKPGTGDVKWNGEPDGTMFRAVSPTAAKAQAVKSEEERRSWPSDGKKRCEYDLSSIKEVPLVYYKD